MKIVYISITCKLCGSENVIRYGHYRGIQRWWCKNCQRKFADNNALPYMRTPIEHVSAAISMYYEGRSLNDIPRIMYQLHAVRTTPPSIYKWVIRFSKIAIEEANKNQINVGNTWLANENSVKINGKSHSLIDVIDPETRFLLATRPSKRRTAADFGQVMEFAESRAGMVPERILTNGWKGYQGGVDMTFGADVRHIQTFKIDKQINSPKFLDYWHNTIKDRAKVMLHLKKEDHSQLILDGWLVHYNYFRMQKALNNRTPADIAKSSFKVHSWSELVNQTIR